jgi:hypothetical protein
MLANEGVPAFFKPTRQNASQIRAQNMLQKQISNSHN